MNKRLMKKKSNNLSNVSNEELFTELMKRVPQQERITLFVGIDYREERDHSTNSFCYKMYNCGETVKIVSNLVRGV